MGVRILAPFVVVVALLAGAAKAQQFSSIGFVGRTLLVALGGGGRLFVSEATWNPGTGQVQTGLRVLDVADPTHPRPRGFIPDLPVFNLKAAGTRAYVFGGSGGGLLVIDATDPDRPIHVGSARPPTTISGIALAGDYVYAIEQRYASGTFFPTGIRAISVADPTNPTLVGFVGGSPLALAADGSYLYAVIASFVDPSEPRRLAVYGLADPTSPIEVGTYPLPSDGWPPDLVAASRGRVYVANVVSATTSRYDPANQTQLRVLDVSNPAAPVQVGALTTDRGSGQIVLAGTRLYLSQYAGGVKTIDVSDSARPTVLGSYALPGLATHALDAAGAIVYAGEGLTQTNLTDAAFVPPEHPSLEVADLSAPANGRELGRYNPASRARLLLLPDRSGI